MAKKNVSSIVSGMGLATGIITSLVETVRMKGGTDEDIHRLATPDGKDILERIADLIVSRDARKMTVCEDDVRDQLRWWESFYLEIYGLELSFSDLRIPETRVGLGRLLVMAGDMTAERLYKRGAELFPSWKFMDDDLVVTSERDPKKGSYAIWHRGRVEADKEHKNKSPNRIKEENITSMTLEERILFEQEHFKRTGGGHLDVVNATMCGGSRFASGSVPSVLWSDNWFRVSYDDPYGYFDSWRAREVAA